LFSPLAELQTVLPEIEFLDDDCDIARFVAGVRGEVGKALTVIRPRSEHELLSIVQALNALEIPYIPQGANTGLVGASVPDASGTQAIVTLEKMKDVFEVDPENRSLRVSAGYRLSEVNQRLEALGLFFPIDLGSDPQIGGMVATNTGGGRYLRYGDVRRQVLGLSLLTKSTAIVTLGGAVRKANIGTDWKQLGIGSGPDFGIITEVVLNLEPIARQQSTALVVPANEAAILPLLQALERMAGPTLSAFEFMSRRSIEAAFEHIPSLRNPFAGGEIPGMVLLIELTRSNDPVPWENSLDDVLEQMLTKIWHSDDVELHDALFGRASDVWALRHALSEGVRSAGKLYSFDLGFRRPDVLAFRHAMETELPRHFPDIAIFDFGHIGDGGLHFNLVGKHEMHSVEFEQTLRDWVVEQAVERFGASFSAEHGIGPKNLRYFEKYSGGYPF